MKFKSLVTLMSPNQDKGLSKDPSNSSTLSNGISLETTKSDWRFANFGYSVINTMVMLAGEIDYRELFFSYWLGYLIFALFVFLAIIG